MMMQLVQRHGRPGGSRVPPRDRNEEEGPDQVAVLVHIETDADIPRSGCARDLERIIAGRGPAETGLRQRQLRNQRLRLL